MKQTMSDFDIFYISYDEPKCEENWADLLQKAPWAKRVHGVKGFDSAHRACAMQSETDRLITIDGDNIIDEKFLELEIDISEKYKGCSLSWNSVNAINGLVYGNGGVKLWTREWIMNMKSHENADDDAKKLDFCWDKTYLQLNSVWSTTYPNGSAFQAFRAGFREGCKMTLDQGGQVDPVKIQKVIYQENLRRLLVWSCVGADIEFGLEAILGARCGIYKTNLDDRFDLSKISDYDWFNEYGTNVLGNISSKEEMIREIGKLGHVINKSMGLDLCLLNEEQSRFFKKVQVQQPSQWSINIENEIVQ